MYSLQISWDMEVSNLLLGNKSIRLCNTLSYNHMENANFLYFEVEAPKGINLIMFRESSMTFSANMR